MLALIFAMDSYKSQIHTSPQTEREPVRLSRFLQVTFALNDGGKASLSVWVVSKQSLERFKSNPIGL